MGLGLDNALYGHNLFAEIGVPAGGFNNGFDVSQDGSKVLGCDTNNGWVMSSGEQKWRPLFSVDTLQEKDYVTTHEDFVEVSSLLSDTLGSIVAIAPTDKNYVCAAWRGMWYFSTDAGHTMSRNESVVPKRQFFNTGPQRVWNSRIKVSPVNKMHALLGTTNDSVFYTMDWGSTIQTVNGTIPACEDFWALPSHYLVDFGPDGRAYIFSQGSGLFSASTLDGTFAAVSGGPEWASHLHVTADGMVLICDPTHTGGFFKYESGSWTIIESVLQGAPHCVASNPNDTDHIVWANVDGVLQQSYDRGVTQTDYWNGIYPAGGSRITDGDTPWMLGRAQFPSELTFDPSEPNKLCMTTGIGFTHSNPPLAYNVPWNWTAESAGIRQIVVNHFLPLPNGKVLMDAWDLGSWLLGDDPSDLSVTPKFPPRTAFSHHWQSDFASDDPDYVVCAAGQYSDWSWFSEDSAVTLNELFVKTETEGGNLVGELPSGQAGGNGGAVAVSARANQIIVPGINQLPIYTKNEWGGSSKLLKEQGIDWDYIDLPIRIPNDYVRRYPISADKTREGVFAAVVSSSFGAQQGLHVSLDGGDTWDQKITGQLNGDPSDYWACKLSYIPQKTGELLYTSGVNFNSELMHFTDDATSGTHVSLGATWGMTRVSTFGFGIGLPGQSYPTLFFMGEVEGQFGLYRSTDLCATKPTFLTAYPGGLIDGYQAVSGNAQKFGWGYAGSGGSGGAWWKFVDLAIGR